MLKIEDLTNSEIVETNNELCETNSYFEDRIYYMEEFEEVMEMYGLGIKEVLEEIKASDDFFDSHAYFTFHPERSSNSLESSDFHEYLIAVTEEEFMEFYKDLNGISIEDEIKEDLENLQENGTNDQFARLARALLCECDLDILAEIIADSGMNFEEFMASH